MDNDQTNISTRDLILEMHGDIKKLIGSQAATDATLAAVAQGLKDHVKDDDNKHEDIDKWRRGHDGWRNRIMGYGAAIAFVVGIVVSFAEKAVAAALHWR